MSALLPAAELLLRGMLDSVHRYWQADQSCRPVQEVVEEVRRHGCLRLRTCTREEVVC